MRTPDQKVSLGGPVQPTVSAEFACPVRQQLTDTALPLPRFSCINTDLFSESLRLRTNKPDVRRSDDRVRIIPAARVLGEEGYLIGYEMEDQNAETLYSDPSVWTASREIECDIEERYPQNGFLSSNALLGRYHNTFRRGFPSRPGFTKS